jgi:pyrroloquinoline quinone (PQQ) biosynthesis protein C
VVENNAEFVQLIERTVIDGMAQNQFGPKVRAGAATRQELAIFAVQTYHRNLYSSRFASACHSRCPVPEIRRALLEVIIEEEAKFAGEEPSHADLMLVFAEALGLRRGDVVQARPLPSTRVFIDTIMQLSQGHWLEGIAFRASELVAPKKSAGWIDALQQHYGFPPEALVWWQTHQVADVRHSSIALQVYSRFVRDDSEKEICLRAVERMLAAWRVFDAGIVEAGEEARAGRDVGFSLASVRT